MYNIFTNNLDWEIGHNLDAFNALLCGGFRVHEYDENITIIWKYSNKNKKNLGFDFDVIIKIIEEYNNIKLILR